jgi:hypothetical protein
LGDFRIAGSTSAFTIVISIECHTDWLWAMIWSLTGNVQPIDEYLDEIKSSP